MSRFSDLLKSLTEKTTLLHKSISENNYDLAQILEAQRSKVITELQLANLSVSERAQLKLTVDSILRSEKEYRCVVNAEKEKTEQELTVFLNKKKQIMHIVKNTERYYK